MNFHFCSYCNFKCKYCFARFDDIKKPLSKQNCLKIIKALYYNGTEKINFAGGEPTLSPFLGDLLVYSKELGLKTSVISNGTGINKKFLRKYRSTLNWLGLSLDSGCESIQFQLGRGDGNYVQDIVDKCKIIKNEGIKLKINSVITKLNYNEDMSFLLKKINPDRWKVFQVLKIKENNHKAVQELLISNLDFDFYISKHKELNPITENNNQMIDSYVMIDPQGRFYQNSDNIYLFSNEILKVGVISAFNTIQYSHKKFLERGGKYF